jgi:hypothetical protein
MFFTTNRIPGNPVPPDLLGVVPHLGWGSENTNEQVDAFECHGETISRATCSIEIFRSSAPRDLPSKSPFYPSFSAKKYC